MLQKAIHFFGIKPAGVPKLIGGAFMLLWALSFSIALSLSKTLDPHISNVVIVFMRYLFAFIFFTPFIFRAGFKGFKTSRPFLHLIRVVCLGTALTCTYYAYRELPLVLATSIGMTAPLFTTILAMLLLKESVSPLKWLFIILGYIGVLVVVRPHELPVGPGVWASLTANIFSALTMITVKVLSRTESTFTLMLYINTFTTFVAGIFVIGVWENPSYHDFIILGLVGAFGLVSQYSLITALKYAEPSYLAPIEYTRMCFAIPVGYFLFDETPSFWVLVGSLIIIAATFGLTRLEMLMKTPRPEQDSEPL